MGTTEEPSAVEEAQLGCLSEAVGALLPALEQFNRFEGADGAARERSTWRPGLDASLPERGAGLDTVLDQLVRLVVPFGVRTGAPGFSGWVTTAPTTAGVVAALAATVAGSQRYFVQPFNHLEAQALRWLAELLGLPDGFQGIFSSGGSVANLVGLAAARQHAFERAGHDPAHLGIPGGMRAHVYATSQVHHVVRRAAAVLGLGRDAVVTVAEDDAYRMDVAALGRALAADAARGVVPVAVVANGGAVNTGAVDPLSGMAELAHEHGSWLHVDGSYGLFGVVDPGAAGLFEGLPLADSVAVDPHKWLAVPVGCGATFVRDAELLERCFGLGPAEYLARPRPVEAPASPFEDLGEAFLDLGLEHSAPSRGVLVWAALLEIGADGMRRRVGRHIGLARRLADHAGADERLELLADPCLSICCFRYRRPGCSEEELDHLNQAIVLRLWAGGRHVPSTTRIRGQLAIRCCFINPRTTAADVDAMVEEVVRTGDSLA